MCKEPAIKVFSTIFTIPGKIYFSQASGLPFSFKYYMKVSLNQQVSLADIF
jgi:hypothetical protein